jgi:hypothetical protein
MSSESNQTPSSEQGFIDEKQLLARLPVSRGTLGNWKAKGLIPYIKIGRRCLYDWLSVQGALQRRQRGRLARIALKLATMRWHARTHGFSNLRAKRAVSSNTRAIPL